MKDKVIKGVFWVFALKVVGYLFSFLRLTILARILLPSDFGLIGIALLTLSIIDTFSQVGFKQALIQKKEDVESYLDNAWSFLALRGIILYLIIYFFSFFSSYFFKSPQAVPIIRVMALSVILSGFTNIKLIYFQKEFEFKKQFYYELLGTIVDFTFSITLVFILRNVWALVLGSIAGNITRCILSFFIIPYRPRFSLDFEKIKELWDFGRWAMASNILIFFSTQGDDIFVGRFLGTTFLGLYQMAYRLSNMPATEITHTISAVSFPAYSKLQDEMERLKNAYLKIYQMTVFFSFYLTGLIFTLSDDFIRLFFTSKWEPAITAIKILSIEGLLRAIGATTGPIFYAIKKPKYETFWQFIRLLIIILLIYPFTSRYKIAGTSFVVLLSVLVSTIGFVGMCKKLIDFDVKKLIKISLFATISMILMYFSYILLLRFFRIQISYIKFFLMAFIISLVYFISFVLFSRFMPTKQIKLIKEAINEFIRKNKE